MVRICYDVTKQHTNKNGTNKIKVLTALNVGLKMVLNGDCSI